LSLAEEAQRNKKKTRRGRRRKTGSIQRKPSLCTTIGFILLQYQPPETEATEQGIKNK
jgi:hypothetical protein